MANGAADSTVYGPDLSLTPSQQSLLRTALSSNTPEASVSKIAPNANIGLNGFSPVDSSGNVMPVQQFSGLQGGSIDQSPDQGGIADPFSLDDSPFIDGQDYEDANFDWDNTEEQFFGDLPEETAHENGIHDKRKSNDDGENKDGNNKRHEGNDKNSKKPGRKPLNSSEPTTKRKAQNRAAQRAFRERKERHLKDLEVKVEDLEKASEATNHENGRLRATVDRLNSEVREYRQRLSLTATSYSPPRAQAPQYPSNTGNNDFHFAFPKFGDLPGSSFMSNGSLARTSTPNRGPSRATSGNIAGIVRAESSNSSNGRSPTNNGASPVNRNRGTSQGSISMSAIQASPVPLQANGIEDFSGLFSPSIIASVSQSNSSDYTFPATTQPASSIAKQPEVQSPSDSNPTTIANRASTTSMTGSPSISSVSHGGMDSSCGTTPEPSTDTQDQRKSTEGTLRTINEESAPSSDEKRKFCGKWASSCGNSTNPVPRDLSQPEGGIAPLSNVAKSPMADINGIDWMAQQNGGQFDPVLFGDYRDTQNDLFSNDFFSDAFLNQDFSTPFNMAEDFTPAEEPRKEPKKDLMQKVEEQQNADHDEVVPGEVKQFLTCDKLWDRVQQSERAQSGEVDMDTLCSQLKAKAKCSGSGAVIEQKDVDAILGPPPDGQRDFLKMFK
ncbi:MAG: hypothetical protein Q9218_003778 [Villophora microphyllina]